MAPERVNGLMIRMIRRETITGSLIPIFPIFLFLFGSAACKGTPTTPEPHRPPEQVEYYDYELTYKRTKINMPERGDPDYCFLHVKDNLQVRQIGLSKVNDYEFIGFVENLSTNLEGDTLPSNWIYVVDSARWEDSWKEGFLIWGKPHSVGDIFILRNLQTGVEHQLTKVVNASHVGAPPECKAQEARFKQKKGGIIVDVDE